jgi:hypothetical protein
LSNGRFNAAAPRRADAASASSGARLLTSVVSDTKATSVSLSSQPGPAMKLGYVIVYVSNG